MSPAAFSHVMVLLSLMTSGHAKFLGPWKTTIATDYPERASSFAIRYLGAKDYNLFDPEIDEVDKLEDPTCLRVSWVYFPSSPITSRAQTALKLFRYYQFHFVYQGGKCSHPGAPLSVKKLDLARSTLNSNFSVYTPFEDRHVNMETTDLDPLAASLAWDGVPFLLRANSDRTFSLFVAIPHACAVHVIAPRLTVATPPESGVRCPSCTGIGAPTKIDWDLVEKFKTFKKPGLTIKRSVFGSTAPAASAKLLTKYFPGSWTSTSLPESSSRNASELQTVRWVSNGGYDHEFVWVHRPLERQGTAALAHYEQYLLELRGNLSAWSYLNWEPFMNNHVGLLVDDCYPIFKSLQTDNVPYVLGDQGYDPGVFSILLQDSTANLYEFVCLDTITRTVVPDRFGGWLGGKHWVVGKEWVPQPHPPKIDAPTQQRLQKKHMQGVLRLTRAVNTTLRSRSRYPHPQAINASSQQHLSDILRQGRLCVLSESDAMNSADMPVVRRLRH